MFLLRLTNGGKINDKFIFYVIFYVSHLFQEQISDNVGKLWILFEPIMFGLIGAEIRLDKLDSSTVGLLLLL